jgi:hypothetical protein
MTILHNPDNSFEFGRNLGSFTGPCGPSFNYRQYERKVAYKDTEYISKKELGLSLEFMPYDRLSREDTDFPLPGGKYDNASFWNCYGGIFPTYVGATKAEADLEILKKVADQQFNLAVALGELPESIGLVASTAKRIGTAYHKLRSGNVKAAFRSLGIRDNVRLDDSKYARFAKAIPRRYKTAFDHKRSLIRRARRSNSKSSLNKFAASSWLELQYGWVPLLSDVYNAAEMTARKLNEDTHDLVYSAYSIGDAIPTIANHGIVHVDSSSSGAFIIRREARYRITNPTLRNASAFGLTNPFLLGWELVPFSFVVDWFLPVGDWLQASLADVGLTYVGGGYSTFKKAEMSGFSTLPYLLTSGSRREVHLQREIAGPPVVSFPPLDLLNSMNVKRFTDSLSLLRVVFGR